MHEHTGEHVGRHIDHKDGHVDAVAEKLDIHPNPHFWDPRTKGTLTDG